jgi:hypothetical protein
MKLGEAYDCLHQPTRQPLSSMFFQNKHVHEVGKGDIISEDACITDLSPLAVGGLVVDAKGQGVARRALHQLARDAWRPVGA